MKTLSPSDWRKSLKRPLTAEEVEKFHQLGYAGPFTLCSPEEMESIRQSIESKVLSTPSPSGGPIEQSRHLDSPVVWDLCQSPAIVDRMASLLGPNLVLWRSHFFNKEPGGKEVPWHQDINYWPIEPTVNISAWLAIDRVTVENSCVQLIPGSHRKTIPHIKATSEMLFVEQADPDYVEQDKAINMELEPGQFFLFTERLLHHSEPNRSDHRRLGLAVRVTIPQVKVDHRKLFDGHRNILLRGEDFMGLNRLGDPPAAA